MALGKNKLTSASPLKLQGHLMGGRCTPLSRLTLRSDTSHKDSLRINSEHMENIEAVKCMPASDIGLKHVDLKPCSPKNKIK